MAKRKSKSESELAKARKRLRAEALPLALETIIDALGGGSMPEARIRAALRVIELTRAHDPEQNSSNSIEIRFDNGTTTETNPDPDPDNPESGKN